MRMSTRGRYGLTAMLDISIYGEVSSVTAKDISERQNISVTYLEQLLSKLKRAGLVKGTRGPGGGYQLNKPPDQITIGDIIRVLEGPIAPVYCVLPTVDAKQCDKLAKCAMRLLWKKLGDKMSEVLDSITLKDLKEESLALEGKKKIKHNYVFNI
ncbi:MAG: Rrf2 family transcriptional regulator [bacterium]|nr:Rrf2 family transcriptional regulator [bacterium]